MKNIDIVNADLSKISKSADQAGDAVDKLSKDMQNLAQEAKTADTALQEFNNDNFDLLETMENATRVTAGFVGAVEVAQGTLHLMGVDNEFVNKSLEDMMALMQVSQGLTDMADGIKSFKMLKEMIAASTAATTVNTTAVTANAAAAKGAAVATTGFGKALAYCKTAFASLTKVIKANPYTAIATVLISAVAALAAFAKKSDEAAKKQQMLADAQKKVIDATKKSVKEADHAYRIMKAQGVEEDKALERKIKMLQAEEANLKLRRLELKEAKRNGEDIKDELFTELDDEINNLHENIDGLQKDLEIFNIQSTTDAKNAAKEAAEARIKAEKDANTKIFEERKAAQKELNEEFDELLSEQQHENKTELDIELKDIQVHTQKRLKYWKQMYNEQKISAEDFTKISNQLNISSLTKQQEAIAASRKEILNSLNDAKNEFNKFMDQEQDFLINDYFTQLDLFAERTSGIANMAELLDNQINFNFNKNNSIDIYFAGVYEKVLQQSRTMINKLYGFFDENKFDKNLINKIYGNLADTSKENITSTVNDLQKVRSNIDNVFFDIVKQIKPLKREYAKIFVDKSIDPADKVEQLDNLKKAIDDLFIKLQEAGAAGNAIDNIQLSIINLANEQIVTNLTHIDNKFDSIQQNISLLSEKFNELQQISAGWGPEDGISDKWNNVFGSISAGIEKVRTGFKDAEKDTNKAGKAWKKYGALASAGLSVASNMMQAIADEQDETTEKGFERQKKWQIGAATMSMLGGIIDAWASAFMPSNGIHNIWAKIALGGTMSTLMLTTGLMQINKIKKTKFGGEPDTNSIQAIPAAGALDNMQSGMQYANIIEGASTEGQVDDTRVYVLESDIANTHNKVKVAQSEATF